MVKVGKWIAKHKVLVLLIGLLLVIPSVIGIAETRVNYDLFHGNRGKYGYEGCPEAGREIQ